MLSDKIGSSALGILDARSILHTETFWKERITFEGVQTLFGLRPMGPHFGLVLVTTLTGLICHIGLVTDICENQIIRILVGNNAIGGV